jgi:rhodanese-related sulfurtransferase
MASDWPRRPSGRSSARSSSGRRSRTGPLGRAAIIASKGTLDLAYPPLILATTAATEGVPLIDVDELHGSLASYTIVDACEGFEHRHAHIAGAVLFPPGDAWERMDELPDGTPLAVVCGDQTRSAYVASILRRRGRDAVLVMGGMVDWLERGYPTERTPAPAA